MPTDSWFGGLALSGLVVTVLAFFWRQLKGAATRVLRLLVCKAEIGDQELANTLARLLMIEGRSLSSGALAVHVWRATARATGRMMKVPIEGVNTEPRLVWFRGGLVLLAMEFKKLGENVGQMNTTLTYLRWTLDVRALVFRAAEELNGRGRPDLRKGSGYQVANHDGTIGITRTDGMAADPTSRGVGKEINPADMYAPDGGLNAKTIGYPRLLFGEPRPADPLACFVANAALSAMLADCERWLRSKEFCEQRGLPWRRGWLLHGEPGGGKSTAVRLVAQKYELPVHTFAVGTLRPQEFRRAWELCQTDAPCVAVWEDLDAVFRGRENVTGEEGALTFDVVLNAVSGVKPANGVLLVVSTNTVAAIDDALGRPTDPAAAVSATTRPGRLDVAFRFDRPTPADRLQLATKLLGGLLPDAEVEDLAAAADGETVSTFHHRLIERAVAHYWATAHPEPQPALPVPREGCHTN